MVQKAGGLAFTAFLMPWAELFRDCKTTLFGVNESTERARGLNCLAARNMVRRRGHGGDPAHTREAGHVVATRWLIKEAGPHHGKDSRQLAASLNLSGSGKRGLLTNSRWGVLFFSRAYFPSSGNRGLCDSGLCHHRRFTMGLPDRRAGGGSAVCRTGESRGCSGSLGRHWPVGRAWKMWSLE